MRVHSWLNKVRPTVFVLTDGSGHGDRGRIGSTADVLTSAGAAKGSIFGRLTDRQAYELILEHRTEELKGLVRELADGLEQLRPAYVLSDAVEGLNPVHDLCCVLTVAALELLFSRFAIRVDHYEFVLAEAPAARRSKNEDTIFYRLSDAELQRKLDRARDYAELRPEVDSALAAWGEEAFRLEVLHPVKSPRSLQEIVGERPSYEAFGARRLEEGVYSTLLQFHQHFEPVASSILEWSGAIRPLP
ncbi:MAG: hypothetical protein MPN21_00310 [Thermoanaerobaculia bacterium]|nr:hypothetical protein [Thermoanaerobaculia bacterium]